jgi:mediator of RNA polymerase II transcription subunit 20
MRDFTYIAENVTKSFHGKNTGSWSLAFKVFRDTDNRQSVSKDSKFLYQVSLTQRPGYVYCMVDGSVVVEVEKEMEMILSRLKNLWHLRQSVTIEVDKKKGWFAGCNYADIYILYYLKGTSYEIGDFTLRVANILIGSTYKGLLLEVSLLLCG